MYTYTVINFVYTILHKCTQNTHKKAQRQADEEVPSTPISSTRVYMGLYWPLYTYTNTLECRQKSILISVNFDISASPFILPTRYMLTSPPLGHWSQTGSRRGTSQYFWDWIFFNHHYQTWSFGLIHTLAYSYYFPLFWNKFKDDP